MSRPDPRRDHVVALWTALAVTVLWSSSWVLIRTGLDDEALTPVTFAGLRYGLASLVLLAAVAASRSRRCELLRLERDTVIRLSVLGVVVYAVTQGAQFVAIDNQPAATTSLVLSLTPLLVAVVSTRRLGEHAARRQFVGAGMVLVGASIYFAGDLGATTVGLAAATVGLAANVSGATRGRLVNRAASVSPLIVTTVSMSVGAVVLASVGVVVEGVPDVTARGAALVAWLAIVNTALAFTLWNFSLRRLSALESAGVNNTMLIQIAILAWIVLGEFPGAIGLGGILTVSLGIFLTQGTVPRRQVWGARDDDAPSGPDRSNELA